MLGGLGAAVAGLCLRPAAAASASQPAPQIEELTGKLFVVRGAGGNICVLADDTGYVLVDTGAAAAQPALARVLQERVGRASPQWAINTHWHPDRTGGNEALRRAGAQILAHENTRLWMGAPILSRWNGTSFAPRPSAAWPTQTFYTERSLQVAGAQIDCGYLLQAHTDGDIYAHFREANVLVTGDVFTAGTYPVTDPATLGWIGGLTTATEQLLKVCDAETRIVPGTGPVQRRGALEAQLNMLTTVRERLYTMLRDGRGVDEMLAAKPTAEFDAQWGDPREFIRAAFVGMAAHVRQIPGIV